MPQPTTESLIIQALCALGISLFSAWVTIQLSRKKFRAERLWDRKVVSYERVIEAFHKSKKFSVEHLNAEERGHELSDKRVLELQQLAKEALEEIKRTADIGSFTLSDGATAILAEYQRASVIPDKCETWYEQLEYDFDITDKFMKKFIAEAKRDLGQ